jgi:uncharacterized membrane protein YtjA (UPF0391 family)
MTPAPLLSPQIPELTATHKPKYQFKGIRPNLAAVYDPVSSQRSEEEGIMLYWTIVFLVIALIAGILGFTGVAVAAAGIAKLLFFVFLVLFVISLITHLGRRGSGV